MNAIAIAYCSLMEQNLSTGSPTLFKVCGSLSKDGAFINLPTPKMNELILMNGAIMDESSYV